MLCILHGYLLEGSGSNLWTRSIIGALCKAGETVHLVCQENHPDRYGFVAEAVRYRPDGGTEELFERETPYPGRCVLHKPELGETLPVYVRDRYEEFRNVVPMAELPDEVISDYLDRNLRVVERVVRQHGVRAMLANHAVLMSVVARRASAATGIPYAVMPHGSAIEYAVKKDARMLRYATGAFEDAGRIFTIGEEMRRRIRDVFGEAGDLESKLVQLHLGVDSDVFQPLAREDRPRAVERLVRRLSGLPRAEGPEDQLPGAGVEKELAAVDWTRERVVLYVGRLIPGKGPQTLLRAAPEFLSGRPRTRLVLVGHGPLREPLEALAAETGIADRVVFTGYLSHDLLRHLFPCADAAVFPSKVAEAGPMVFLEALSSGCFPLGTYFAGMAASIDSLAGLVPQEALDIMKLDPDPARTVSDIAAKVPLALDFMDRHRSLFHQAVKQRYEWRNVARVLADELRAMGE